MKDRRLDGDICHGLRDQQVVQDNGYFFFVVEC